MFVVLVIIGIALILFGVVVFAISIGKVLYAMTVPFWKESWMDKKLFRIWEKEKDYKEFEKKIKL
tara:strand:- start:11633 stop:11827 length:195 start_codon:yes stop_codon:yes gene_type:complete